MSWKNYRRRAVTLLALCVIVMGFSDCASRAKMTLGRGGGGGIHSLAFSPDGKTLASGGTSGRIRLWDVETGEIRREFTHGGADASTAFLSDVSIAFSPDGETLASGNSAEGAGDLRLWDAASGSLKQTLKEEEGWYSNLGVESVAFSPDGETVAGAGVRLRLWDAQNGESRLITKNGSNLVTYSPDGKTIASGGGNRVRILDAETGDVKRVFRHGDDYTQVHSIAFSPDGKTIVSGSSGRSETVKLWDVETGKLKLTLNAYKGSSGFGVESVAFSPDGKMVASGNRDSLTVTLWDAQTGELKRTLRNGGLITWLFPNTGGYVEAIAFSPDGTQLAGGDSLDKIKLWDVSDLK